MRVGLLGSTRGTHLTTLVNAIAQKKLSIEIAVVLSNKQDALILQKAELAGIPAFFVDPASSSRETYDNKLTELLLKYQVDFIVLIGYMRILSKSFVTKWHHRIINIHPSLLPKHAGKMDLAVHQSVIDAGETEAGCTVHYVVEKVDAGPILMQKSCSVSPSDTAETLKARVQQLEGEALIEVLRLQYYQKDNPN